MKKYNVIVLKTALAKLRTQSHLTELIGVRVKAVETRGKNTLGYYEQKTSTIVIHPQNHENLAEYVDTLLHELAHHVVHYYQKKYDSYYAVHGKEWRQVAEFLGANPRAVQLHTHKKTKLPNYIQEAIDATN